MPRYYIGNIPCGKADLAHYGVPGMEWGKHKFGIDANTKYVNWWKPPKGNAGNAPRSSVAVGGGSAHPLKDQIKADNQKKQQQRQAARSNAPRMVGQLQQIATNQRKAESWNQKHPGNGPAPIYGDDAAAKLGNDRLASQTRFMNSQQQMALSQKQNDANNAQNQQTFAENFRNSPAMKGQVAANIAYDSVNPRGGVAGYFGGDAERANAAAANARAEQNPTERNKALANEANQALAKYESGIRPTIYNAGTAVGNAVGTAANNVGEYLSRDAVDQRYADYLANRGYPSSTSGYNDQALADYQYAHGLYNPQYQGFNGIYSIPGVIGNNARELATTVGSRIQGGLGNAYDTVTDIGGRIGTSIVNTAGDIGNWIGGAANNVGNWIGQRANDVGNWFGGVGNTIGNAAQGVGNWFGGVGNTIGNAAQGVGGWIGDRVANIGDFANRAGDWIGGVAGNVGGWIGDRAADVQNWWTGDRDRAEANRRYSDALHQLTSMNNRANMLGSSTPNYSSDYQQAVANYNAARQGVSDARNAGFRNQLAGIPGAVGNWAGGVADNVGNWAMGVPGRVNDFFTGDQSRAAMENIRNQIAAGNPEYFGNAGVQAMQNAVRGYQQTLPGMFEGIPLAITNAGYALDAAGNVIGQIPGSIADSAYNTYNRLFDNSGAIASSNGQMEVSPMFDLSREGRGPYTRTQSVDTSRGRGRGGYTRKQTIRHDSIAIGKAYKGSCLVKDISYPR